ncbi:MAG: hypothetical protein J0H55_06700 [Chitinophagaceae bacterium]|nr:hypothetical protein [Chitinophagaceae bacterium]
MKKIFIPIFFLYAISFFSCGQKNTKKELQKANKKNITDVRSYTGNAFIFSDPEIYRARCFIIPVDEKDTTTFRKLNVEKGIKGRICIQMFLGHSDLLKLVNDRNKDIISYKACNLPKDSMFFSRVFISYKNCVEIKRTDAKGNVDDSCNSKLVERTDSTEGFFYIYQ